MGVGGGSSSRAGGSPERAPASPMNHNHCAVHTLWQERGQAQTEINISYSNILVSSLGQRPLVISGDSIQWASTVPCCPCDLGFPIHPVRTVKVGQSQRL